jgi:hypothetical protein
MKNDIHVDCEQYVPVDVFKGLCRADKQIVMADEKACKGFKAVQKCKHCKNFKTTTDNLGRCMDKADAYPEMISKTCGDFKWKKE